MIKSLKYKYLIQQYKNRIYNYANYMLKNRMDADDVTQEVFIKIWKNIDNFNFSSSASWIMKTTHNLCIDYLRRRSANMRREINIDGSITERLPDNDRMSDPEIEVRKNMLKRKISNAIEMLPEQLKSVFIMYEMQGLRYREISEITGFPLNSVKVYLLRARKKLQEELKVYKDEKIESY